jgi:RNA polymerase sigma-70 factor (ECF subfamily)
MPAELDKEARELCASGHHKRAIELVLHAYGGEIMGFLVSRANDGQLATDAFAVLSEDLCRGIPNFEFRCSLRTWIYTLAHHALAKCCRMLARDIARAAPLPDSTARETAVRLERSETPPYLRSEIKEQLLALRAGLAADDQLLLDLRLGQRFSWKDIARIHLNDQNVASRTIDTEAARLRKRFQALKEMLRDIARSRGLLPVSDDR